MRIAMVANWWYRRGGLGAVMLDEAAELERRGYDIAPFAAAHPDNLPSRWSEYFPGFRETGEMGAGMSAGAKAGTAFRLVRNGEAVRKFGAFLDASRPDVVHLHNAVRQLSPAILGMARKRRIPVIVTWHDYSLVCPQGKLLKGETRACTPPNCVHGNPLPVFRYKCIRRRRLPSLIAAVEYGTQRFTRAYSRSSYVAICPSHFLERTLVDAGIKPASVRYLPNGVAPGEEPQALPKSGGTMLYTGRLVVEKGLDVLLEAARRLPEIPVVIAGDGPLRSQLEKQAPASVRFVGHLTPEELGRARAEAVAILSPSVWYENAPIAILEAMRDGRPTIASEIGGQTELLTGGGLLTPAGDAAALAVAMERLWKDRGLAAEMGAAARVRLLAEFTLDRHVTALEAIYREALRAR